ncbi:hypothetical protein F4821DRAFT_255859 [Hypoxylon rubiginosum]|uniref:Uncharacterized protein n=1 Tax=Hypoxylon rubiginosum TaxID=110542 RepID=A0ACC0DDA0_9PEZI|nr:hypothetical protein F4821DRAFT_255859 [Hypoxylon rubiginosum]
MADDSAPKSSRPDKKSHKKHKRHHEADGAEGSERKHKKSKSSALVTDAPVQIEATQSEPPTSQPKVDGDDSTAHKKKKKRKHEDRAVGAVDEEQPTQNGAADSTPKKEKKSKERKKKHKGVEVNGEVPQSSAVADSQEPQTAVEQASEPEPMDIDSAPADTTEPREFGQKPNKKKYPFFTQTVSQYLPLFPSGLVEPIEGFADQHLRPLLNRYVPSFRGVLLAYRNPRVGEAPGKGSLTEESGMEDVVLLESINEYAVNYGWLTVEVDLFCPTRGAWMEGSVNLQGEGHIGVVCWDMFNASIEAARLPRGWRWVDLLSKGKETSKDKGKNDRRKTAEEAKLPTPEPLEDQENDETQIHTTGYWVDESGTRIRGGSKLYFRIKHYEVGISGDYGYLSMEGTMLGEVEEKAKYVEEMEVLRRRKLRNGGQKVQKRLPEFSMTKFTANEADEDETQRAPVQWVASHPGSDAE